MPIPKIVVTAALMAAQVALGMTRKISGPRLESLKTTTAEYGTPIPRFWGKRRFECPVIWAEDLRETKKTHKGKGGKQTEYRYFATFAALIADHEIDAVSRIWFDDKLVYQATSAGPVSLGSIIQALGIGTSPNSVNLALGRNMRIYLGTETQSADPRMEEWCEDRYGADSCPAYRGSAYIVFEDIPVNNFGNRIPNITVEAISDKADAYPYELKTGGYIFDQLAYSPNYSLLRLGDGIWDVASRTKIVSGTPPLGITAIDNEGMLWGPGGGPADPRLIGYSMEGALLYDISCPRQVGTIMCAGNHVLAAAYVSTHNWVQYRSGTIVVDVDVGFSPQHYFADEDGNAWASGRPDGASTTIGFYNVDTAQNLTVTGPTTTGAVYAMDNGAGQFFCSQNGILFLVDKTTGTLVSQTAAPAGVGNAFNAFRFVKPGSETIWLDEFEVSTRTMATVRSVNFSNWVATPVQDVIYDPVNHALITREFSATEIIWRYLDRVSSPGVQLKDVVDDVSGWAGLAGQDTAALTQTIYGYSVTQGTGKDMLDPLLTIHDVDPRPHDFSVQFVVRGASPSGTLLTSDFVRESSRYTVTVQQDTDVPRRVTVNFADLNADQQVNNVISQRVADAIDSERAETIDLSTFASSADDAQQLSDRRLRRLWNERERIQLSLTARELALEPGDVRALSLDEKTRPARLQKMTVKGSILETEWVRSEPGLNTLNGANGAEIEGRDPDVIFIPPLAKGFALDIPLTSDADNDVNPLLYVAAGSFGGTWSGAIVYRGDDGTYDEAVASIASDGGATWGFATTALASANPNLWDRGNSLSVTVYGTLTSSTEAAINASPSTNLCALGMNGRWELLNFVTATLTGTSGSANTYTLIGLKRGRRGTEGNVGNHATGDQFILLNRTQIVELGTDDIGDALSFKAQTIGRDPDAAPPIDLTFTGATLKPRAPAVRYIAKDPATGDIKVHIAQRPRTGGNWNGANIPVVEASEAYELDIYSGATLKRTITGSASPLTYTAAQQTTDFGAQIATNGFDGELYQISAVVDRGFVRTI